MEESSHDIFKVIAVLIKEKRKIITSVIIAFIIGVALALILPVEFQSSMKVMPESGDESIGGGLLERFGSLAGLSSAQFSSGESISPALYQDVIKSKKFLYTLIQTPIKFNAKTSTSYYDHKIASGKNVLDYLKEYTIGLIGKLKSVLFPMENPVVAKIEDGIYQIPKEELEIMESLSERITLETDEMNGTINITAKMPTPMASADLVKQVFTLLTEYVEDYKLAKNNNTIAYLETQYIESQKTLQSVQIKASRFFDRNQNIMTQSLLYEQKRIEFEYQVASSIFQNITTQLEQVKLEKQKNTPVFSVINPIVVPVEKSEPKRLIILLIFMMLGFGFALFRLYVTYFFKQLSKEYKKAVDENNV
ncbi:MAG: Wzz/FepE/Etk N-terminal domain-containing protein [Reichenbachiella sp.]|uniref:Wzz/FepE/Etk N-terminal domain-containing protein n=1 Tax=Reichenbachiella sp. TaxID=2184521 RepID=UPI003264BC06